MAALALAASPFFAFDAMATCSVNVPQNGDTVVCTPVGGTDTAGVLNSLAHDVTVNVSGAGASIIQASISDGAIYIGDRARVTVGAGTVLQSRQSTLDVAKDAVVDVRGDIIGNGKSSQAIRAGDRLNLVVGEGARIIATHAVGSGIRARDAATIRVDGLVALTGPTQPSDPNTTVLRGGATAVQAMDFANIVIGRTGRVDVMAEGNIGVSVLRDGNILVEGTVVTRGNHVQSGLLWNPDGVQASQGSTITIARTGLVETFGSQGAGVALYGNVDPYRSPHLGTIDIAGTVIAHGASAPAIRIQAALSAFTANMADTPQAYVHIREGALVYAENFVAISETATSANRRSVDTTLRIAGEVRANPSYYAIALAGGNDTVILEPTGKVGPILASRTSGGIPFNEPGETDSFVLDGRAGTTGHFSFLMDDGEEKLYGFERFAKTGAGDWIVSGGASTFTASGAVEAGRLFVDSALPGLDLTVRAGALLGGSGTLGALAIDAGGVLSPGTGGIATLRSARDVSFAAGSFFAVDVNGTGASDKLVVDGAATINGATLGVLAAPGDYSFAERYTVLDAAGGVTGAFAAVEDNLPDLDFGAHYDGRTVRLGLQASTGGKTSVKVNAAAATSDAADAGMAFTDALAGRFDGGADMGTTAALQPLGYASAYNSPAWGMRTGGGGDGSAALTETGGLAVFLMGAGSARSVAATATAGGYDSSSAGLLGGVEYSFAGSGRTTVGLAAGYSQTNVSVASGGARVKSGHVGIYASHQQDALTLTGVVAYHFGRYELARLLDLGAAGSVTASGLTNGRAVSASGEAFYDLGPALGLDYRIGPVARLRGAAATRDAFVETGAGILNLSVSGGSVSRFYGDIGARFGMRLAVGDIVVTPQFDLRYERMLGGAGGAGTSSIPLAGVSFTTPVSEGARDRFGIGLSSGFAIGNGLSATLGYDGSFGKGVSAHSGTARLTYAF